MSESFTDLSGMCDVSGCDLSGCDLSGCDVSGCDVTGCDLSGTTELVVPSDAQRLVESTWGLRIRSHIQSLSSDISGTLQPQFANYKPTAEKLNAFYFQSMLYLIRFFMLTLQFLQTSWTVARKTGKAIQDSFRDDMYIFFCGSSYPYHLDDLILSSPGVPAVEWYYNATKNTFVTARLQTNSQNYTTHHIPYLSAQIQYNDLTLYDISEFINSVRWAGEDGEPMPSVDHLVSAWSLSSGIVIEQSTTMKLAVINTDGEDVKIPLRNQA